MAQKFIDWFIPARIKANRTDSDLARTFVFTHVFGPLIAQPMWIYLYFVSDGVKLPLVMLALAICGFWALPFLLRWTGSMRLVALISFQSLAGTSLFGSYYYGGFSSPFLPWIVVSLMLGLFYLSKNARLVLALFAADVGGFLVLVSMRPLPQVIPVHELTVLGWLSAGSAAIYMTWMALYYARVFSLRSELEAEARRSRAVSAELERARIVAEETDRARSRFFSKMSHELRTPLNAIIGYSEILLEDREIADPEAGRVKDVRRMHAAGKHLLSLVSSVLDADTVEIEALRVDATRFPLGKLCDEVVASALPMIEKNGNRLDVVCPQGDVCVTTDARKLRQIIINLLSNAGKFTSDGVIRLEIYVDEGGHDDQLRITVSDTGIGIPEDAMSKLFTEYEQGNPGVVAKYGGTGIGLALSRQLCILLGGGITASSKRGRGSVFAVTVPSQLAADAAEPAPEIPSGLPAPA